MSADQPAGTAQTQTNGTAVGSFICGLLSCLPPMNIIAVVLGHMAISSIKKSGNTQGGMPLAVTGTVLGYLGIAVSLIGIAGVVPMMLYATSPRMGQSKLRKKEERYQHIAYKILGQEIAKRHKGAKILMVRYSTGSGEAASAMDNAQMSGLREGIGDAAKIEHEEELKSFDLSDDMGDMMMDPGAMLTAKAFDEMMEDNPKCDVVLSLVGLPYDIQEMKYWKKIEDGKEVPKLVLVNAHVYELKKAIKQGVISIVLQNKPTIYDWKAPVPDDENEAFDVRFILITKDSVDELSATYPNLFAE